MCISLSAYPNGTTANHLVSIIQQMIGFIDKVAYNANELKILDDFIELNNLTISDIMKSLIQPCDELLIKCKWEHELVACSSVFDASQTYYGNCCTFNKNNKIK